ncbi:hypothetical protein OQA88_3248 [Cercophora sp. LCS_1]
MALKPTTLLFFGTFISPSLTANFVEPYPISDCDEESGLKYSKRAVKEFEMGCEYELISDAKLALALAMESGETGGQLAVKLLAESITLDKQRNYLEGQIAKYDVLVKLEGRLAQRGGSSKDFHMARRKLWMIKWEELRSRGTRDASIRGARLCEATKKFKDAEKLAKEALAEFSSTDDAREVAQCQNVIFQSYFRNPTPTADDSAILNQARLTFEAYRSLGLGDVPVEVIMEISMAFEEIGQRRPEDKTRLHYEALGSSKSSKAPMLARALRFAPTGPASRPDGRPLLPQPSVGIKRRRQRAGRPRLDLQGRADARKRGNSLRAAVFAVFEDKASERDKKALEREKVYSCMRMLARDFKTEPLLSPNATRHSLESLARGVDILHYHGHMDEHVNVLHQSLRLSRGHKESEDDDDDDDDAFTVRDAFALRVDAALACIVACSSGVQAFTPGDEPQGLLAALQVAGCASAVGTLWPVDSRDGRDFAAYFYRALHEQHGAGGPVDVAICFQKAVLRLLKRRGVDDNGEDMCVPYHWAAFVLHGAWYL